MKKASSYFGFLAATMLLLSGCGVFDSFTATKVNDVNFKSAYHTYAWLPDKNEAANNAYDNEILRTEIRKAVESELLIRNLKPAEPNTVADLNIQLLNQFTDRNQLLDNAVPNFYWGRFGGYYSTNNNRFYKHNLLTINMFDAKNKDRLVWTCSAEGDLNQSKNLLKDIPPAVATMMKQFPIEPTKNHA